MCSVRCTVTTVTNAAVIIVLTCYLVIVFIVVFSKTPTHCAFTNKAVGTLKNIFKSMSFWFCPC